MRDLVEALTIFARYTDAEHPTHCEHDVLYVLVPSAWEEPIDVVDLRGELIAAIVRRMSAEVLEELFGEIHRQRQRAFWDGESAAKTKIREALGL